MFELLTRWFNAEMVSRHPSPRMCLIFSSTSFNTVPAITDAKLEKQKKVQIIIYTCIKGHRSSDDDIG
jgi:hypothetical protein